MIRHQYDEDLFEDTKMTFGEHLEELRKCLVKAGFGLAIGMAVGLYFATEVVKLLQLPLTDSLSVYYRKRAVDNVKKFDAVPLDANGNLPPDIEGRLASGKMLFDLVYVPKGAATTGNPQFAGGARSLAQASAAMTTAGEKTPDASDTPTSPPEPNDEQRDAAGRRESERLEKVKQFEADPFRGMEPILLWRKVEDDPRLSIKSLSVQENFMIWLKAGFLVGAIISSPWVFWQLWSFVAAGLYPHEKHYVYKYLPFSLVLFLAGAALAFFFVFGFVLEFLFTFNAQMGIDPDPRISEWLSFAILMPLCFGISFQLPLVMLFLERIGVMTVGGYVQKWRLAVLIIAVLSMVFSPGGDPISMLSLFVPLTGLYFLGIWLCVMGQKQQAAVE